MIKEALKYPFQDGSWVKKFIIGSLLGIASVLIVPGFTAMGYLLRCMREDSMPDFNNFLKMTKEGAQAFLVYFAYVIPGIAIIFVFNSGALRFLGLPLVLVAAYMMYSIFYHVSHNGWRAGFSKKVFRSAFSVDYLLGILASMIVSFAIFMVWSFSLILLVTLILMPAVYFYQYVVVFRIMALAIESE